MKIYLSFNLHFDKKKEEIKQKRKKVLLKIDRQITRLQKTCLT